MCFDVPYLVDNSFPCLESYPYMQLIHGILSTTCMYLPKLYNAFEGIVIILYIIPKIIEVQVSWSCF